MPVLRWPRRPAALSEAVAAGAGPDFSCAGELEQPLKALIGEVRSLSVVCVCVSGLVGKVCGRAVDLPPWSVSSRVVCASWALGFVGSRKRIFVCLVTSSRLVVSLRLCLCVFVNTAPLSSPSPVLSFRSLVRSRFGSRNRGHSGVFSALGCGVTRVPPPLAVRCALFSVDGRVGCFSCLNEIGRSFCGASPASGPASGPATPPTRRPP